MKVITLKQPWASLVANGYKKYEFRSWKLNYRGDIIIHAGKGVDKDAMKKVEHLNLNYPSMQLLAIVKIDDCIKLTEDINNQICSENPLIYGNKKRDGYAWKLNNVRPLNTNKIIPGKQGIWNYDL